MPSRGGYGHCPVCEQCIAVYTNKAGRIRLFRHSMAGIWGSRVSVAPDCPHSHQAPAGSALLSGPNGGTHVEVDTDGNILPGESSER